jgi:hypothetical protein
MRRKRTRDVDDLAYVRSRLSDHPLAGPVVVEASAGVGGPWEGRTGGSGIGFAISLADTGGVLVAQASVAMASSYALEKSQELPKCRIHRAREQ